MKIHLMIFFSVTVIAGIAVVATAANRVIQEAGKGQELLDMGLEIYDAGDKATAVTKALESIHDSDRRISELKDVSEEDRGVAEKHEMAQLTKRLKDDVRSLGSGSLLVSALVDKLKAKLPVLNEKVHSIEIPPKADFSFLKQTPYEAASSNPKEACTVVTRLTAGKEGIRGSLKELDNRIEALSGVQTRLSYADNLTNKLWTLLSVPVVNIPVYYSATDLLDLQDAIGPVMSEVEDKRRQLERARDLDQQELAARLPEIDRTVALYQAKHKTDPCQAAAKAARKADNQLKTNKPPVLPFSKRTVPTLSDACLSYTITSRTQSYVHVRIENTCERESIKIEHACTGIGFKPICSSCDEAVALWKSSGMKTCHPGP